MDARKPVRSIEKARVLRDRFFLVFNELLTALVHFSLRTPVRFCGFLLAVGFFASNVQLLAATYKTENFTVHASDANFAQQVGVAAEGYRADLATLWLGEKLPRWSNPCVINVKAAPDLVAGGETVFSFSNGEVYDWKMRVQGSNERILDSVLPHEVTHTIIASSLRAPVPRWLDEGMATVVEADVERSHYRTMLSTFLHTNRGIAFNDMVSMKEYPDDLTPFYSQSFSICEYLINVGGYRRLAAFAKAGSQTNDWNAALKEYYECDSLGALQLEWLGWVREWDVANQPSILPETRKLPDYEIDSPRENAIAQNQNTGRVFGGLRNWGRSANEQVEPSTIARGQERTAAQDGLLRGLSQPFRTRDRNIELAQNDQTTTRAGSVPQNTTSENTPQTQTMPNGTVWRSGENLLSNGAGSASNVESRTDSSLAPTYYRPAQKSAYSNSNGLFRR